MIKKLNLEKETASSEKLSAINKFELEQDQRAMENPNEPWDSKSGLRGGANMSTMLHGKKMFNDEEMLWLNRASICLMSEYSSSLKFD